MEENKNEITENDGEREFFTLTDEEGKEVEFELIDSVEYQGVTYYAMIPADAENESEDGFQEYVILKMEKDEDGEDVYSVTMDLPEDLPREDYYKAAMAELRLSSVMTLEDYTPVSRGDSWEKATAVFGISDYVLSDGYASNAEAPLREHPAVTEFDWEQGIYALVWFDPDCFAGLGLTDAQAMELVAQGLGTLRTAQ